MSDEFYRILKLKQNASRQEIKRAFRKRAKELHPDTNKSSSAHEQFILLNEAYEFLIGERQRRRLRKRAETAQQGPPPTKGRAYDDWIREQGAEARERAKRYAEMRYEEFQKTQFYRNDVAASVVIDYAWVLIALLVLLVPFFVLTVAELKFLLPALVVFAVLSPIPWQVLIKKRTEHKLSTVLPSILILLKTTTGQLVLLLVFNLWAYFSFTFQTLVNFAVVLILGALAFILPYLAFRRYKSTRVKVLAGLIGPALINLFFLLNAVFAGNEHVEQYEYVRDRINVTHEEDGFTVILEDGIYKEYLGIRFFTPREDGRADNHIRYTFKDGALGYRVKTGFRTFLIR